ncbi:MAG: QueG-associated DUF1730 domain-containing protein, partial [Ignavibacteriota bacterium]
MNRIQLTDLIKAAAIDIGFSKVGVTDAAPFDEAADRLNSWVASGAHGLMGYMERNHDKRRDVKNIFPAARSILALATNYYHPEATPQEPNLKISRYAWGDDYHDVIGMMLEDLLSQIKQIIPEAEGKYYVDTG